MKEAICISNSKGTAQRPASDKKTDSTTTERIHLHIGIPKTREKKASQAQAADKSSSSVTAECKAHTGQRRIYNEWIFLCTSLCLCFFLLLTSPDTFRSLSESDGVNAISEYLKAQIMSNESVAVFFGIDGGEDVSADVSVNAAAPSDNDDIPVFVYGEGLGKEEYINKYNYDAYIHGGAVPVYGKITSEYSFRENPFYEVYSGEEKYQFHTGIDISAVEGTEILCYLDGKVEVAALSASYGYHLIIDHGDGIKTLYAHASKLLVDEGEEVKRGQTVALVGSTGRATGAHLHFEVHVNGETVNPKDYLAQLYSRSES